MPTQKNFLVEKLYIDLGFSKKNNTNSTSQFLCDVRNSQSKKTPILEKK